MIMDMNERHIQRGFKVVVTIIILAILGALLWTTLT